MIRRKFAQSPIVERFNQRLCEGGASRRDVLRAALALGAIGLATPLGLRAQARSRFTGYPFRLGVASGYPRPDGITLWTRLAPEPLQPDGGIGRDEWLSVDWQVAEDEGFRRVVAEGARRAVGETSHSVHVDVSGLRPDRVYYYRFLAGDEISTVGRTRTAPAPGASVDRLRFAIGSCQHFEQGYFSAYRHLLDDDADLMVFLGDYIYESSWGDDLVRRHVGGECYSLDDYRVRHAQYRTDADLQAAHAAMPWLLTWDDHEVDNDPAGSQGEHLDPRFLLRRAAAYQAYFEHMPLPQSMRPRVDGSMPIHTRVDYGALASFFMLDDRQYRTPQPCPDPFKGGGSTTVHPHECAALQDPRQTLLGAEQERWLGEGLAASRTRWNLLAQQTLMTPMDMHAGDGQKFWTDGWDGYPLARERLLQQLERPGLGNPVVLGGDIHATVICNLSRDPWGDSQPLAAEVCATSISSQGWPQAVFDQYAAENPHLLTARSDRRGYALLTLGAARCDVAIRTLSSEKTRHSGIETLDRFVVEDGRRGIQRA